MNDPFDLYLNLIIIFLTLTFLFTIFEGYSCQHVYISLICLSFWMQMGQT